MKKSVLCSFLLLVSCSILEDRWECPCVLNLKVNGSCQKNLSLVVDDGYRIIRDNISGETEIYSVSVRRGELAVVAFSCPEPCSGDSLIVVEGAQMPELFYARKRIAARREVVRDSVCIRKQFATVNLRLTNVHSSEGKMSVAVTGNVSGMNLADGTMIAGRYSVVPDSVDGTVFEFRLPRQLDAGLVLDVISNERTPARSRKVEFGAALVESGYDWSAADLDDIYAEIDCSKIEIKINILDWDEEQYEERI